MTLTTQPHLLRNTALAVPVAVVAGALWGVDHAVAAGISGLVILANLWALSVLGPRTVHAVARGENPAFWFALIGLKFVVLTAVVLGLTRVLPPLGVALGFVPMVLGTLITGVQLAQEDLQRQTADHTAVDRSSEEA